MSETLNHILIAGDFNTDKSNDINYLVDIYEAEGLSWISETIGPTYETFSGLSKFTLDHIFSRGFELINAGKTDQTRASDHLPSWVEVKL